MLVELESYENLGTPSYFWELLKMLKVNDGRWTVNHVREYFFNRIIDGKSVFDGCLPCAQAVGIIKIDNRNMVCVNEDFVEFLMNDRYMRGKFLEKLLLTLKEDEAFQTIFSSSNISYDVIYNLIQVDNAAFGFRFSNFRQLLISFGFLNRHPNYQIRKLIINQRYRFLFDRVVLPEIRRRKIGIENLEEMLEHKQIRGAQAEDFVLKFEKQRLSSHPKVESILKISDYDVGAGYDIVSYEDDGSREHNRFIEVKSCSIDRRFYWSKNEVLQARIMRNRYFLYLVDSEKINSGSYEPLVIPNPYKNVFMNVGWKREEQSWLFQPKIP